MRFVVMGAIAIPVLSLLARLYFQTIERLTEYIGFVTTEHWQIGQYYLGEFFMPPPWHFGFVMVWAVLPLKFDDLIRAWIRPLYKRKARWWAGLVSSFLR